MKISATFAPVLLFIMLMGMFLVPLSRGNEQPPTSRNELPLHELLLNKQVFTRGETLNISVLTNVDTVMISVYGPERLFLSYNQKANTSTALLIDAKWSFGFWNVTATFDKTQIGSSFTILNDGDYVDVSFPYTRVHLGTNYTLTDKGINATTLSTNRTIAITYPTVASLTQRTITVECNNMSVRAIMLSGKNKFVVTYAFIHFGVEFTVNGSTESANNFQFRVNGSGKQSRNSFRCGNIAFDWSDIAASGLSISWSNENKTLSVNAGKDFIIDPYLITDGFESGDINAGGWGWYDYEPSVVSAPVDKVWKGNYSCLIGNHGDSGMGLIKYLYGNDTAELNLRAYFYISTLPSINQSASP